jgi:hypothetical protein
VFILGRREGIAKMDESTGNAQETEDEEMVVDYANNVAFEASVWDLKLTFGEASQRTNSVDWHTSITIPWVQAKLMIYFLQANVAAYEINSGKIKIPDLILPAEWPSAVPTEQASDPKALEVLDALKKLREQFLASLK